MAKPHTSHSPYSLEYLYSLEKTTAKENKKEKTFLKKRKSVLKDRSNQTVEKTDDERTL